MQTFKEMIDYARKNPGKLAFGSPGHGTLPPMRMKSLIFRIGIELLHVPYRSGADTLTDLLALRIPAPSFPIGSD